MAFSVKRFVFGFLLLGAVAAFLLAMLLVDSWPKVPLLRDQYVWVKPRGLKEQPEIQILPKRPASWVGYSEISRKVIGAVVVSEDWAFFGHEGVDWAQMREAIETDVKKGKLARGGSTITQQLVKNVFLSRKKSFVRKFEELIIATRTDALLSKKRILELYFNVVEWGPRIFGIQKAAQFYFSKHPSQLSAKEGAFLAMLLPSPLRYGQSFRNKKLTGYAEKTVSSILDKMVRANFLTEEERQEEEASPLAFEIQNFSDPESEVDQTGVDRTEL